MGKFQDLTGQRFGRLVVIKRGETIISNNGNYITQWWCQCDCGSEPKLIRAVHLKSGATQSCGCLSREITSKQRKKYNKFEEKDNYYVGYTSKNQEFYFDKEDYDTVCKYCWYIDNNGYVTTNDKTNNGKQTTLRMHVLILNPKRPDLKVDHIHGRNSRNDNRRSNLRIVTNQENAMNAQLKSNNTSGITGVSLNKRNNKWVAQIKTDGKEKYLGEFVNFEDAVRVRKEAEKKYFGEFAYDYSQQISG